MKNEPHDFPLRPFRHSQLTFLSPCITISASFSSALHAIRFKSANCSLFSALFIFSKRSCLIDKHTDIATYAVAAFGHTVYRFAFALLRSSHQAEDVYQETFLALHSSHRTFKSDDHLKAWLLKVAGNRCRTIFRERKRHREDLVDPVDFSSMPISDKPIDSTGSPGEHGIWDIVDTLSGDQREAIYLFYVEGYSVEEIAEIAGVSSSTIRTRLHRARTKIKRRLK